MNMNTRSFVCIVILALILVPITPAQQPRPAAQAIQQRLDFVEALRQGRALLKRGKADQALPLLESALKMATEAKHPREEAAAHDALGDLYARQGQYEVALTHFQQAREGFQAAVAQEPAIARVVGVSDNNYNSDLMFVKVGDTYIRMGKLEEAAGVFTKMQVQKPDTSPLAPAKASARSAN